MTADVEALNKVIEKLWVIKIDVKKESAAWYNAQDAIQMLEALASSPETCKECHGSGNVQVRHGGPGTESERDFWRCDKCDGTGKAQPAVVRPERPEEPKIFAYRPIDLLKEDENQRVCKLSQVEALVCNLTAQRDHLSAKLKASGEEGRKLREAAIEKAWGDGAHEAIKACTNGEWQDVGGSDGLVDIIVARLKERK